jgi:hypothetical protein
MQPMQDFLTWVDIIRDHQNVARPCVSPILWDENILVYSLDDDNHPYANRIFSSVEKIPTEGASLLFEENLPDSYCSSEPEQ